MEPKKGKYLIYLGIAIILLGAYLLIFDWMVSLLSVLFGLWTSIKGYRILNGHQPYLIRKQKEMEEKELVEQKETHPLYHMKNDGKNKTD